MPSRLILHVKVQKIALFLWSIPSCFLVNLVYFLLKSSDEEGKKQRKTKTVAKEWHDPSFVLMCISTLMFFFFGDLIIIKFVLDIFIDSLLTSHHSLNFSNSGFIRISSDFKSLAEANTFVSSAKYLKFQFFRTTW